MELKQSRKFYYRVQQGETIQEICEKFNTSKPNIVRNNNLLNLYAGEWIIIKKNDFILHLVKPMETLEIIANKYNVLVDKLIKDNALEGTKLFIGQQIKIYK